MSKLTKRPDSGGGKRSYPRVTIPRSFTLNQHHIDYLLYRKNTEAINPSRLIRLLIDAEIARTGFVEGDDHEKS